MRVALYARLSRTTDESTSIQRQLLLCRSLAEQRGWTITGEYVDDGVSGAVAADDRPEAGRMMARLTDIDAIIVWKLDRLARSFLGFADLLARCEAANVKLVSATEPIDTSTPIGRAMVQIIAVFAELERSTIRERVLATKAHLRALGDRHVGGRAPYGLKIVPAPDGKGKILVRDAEAVNVLAEIVRRLAYGKNGVTPLGEPRTTIAEDLNQRGIPSPRIHTSTKPNPKPTKHGWTERGILKVVTHPSVMGHRVDQRGHLIRDDQGRPVQFWEPAVDAFTYKRAMANLDARSQKHAPPRDAHWLTGVLRCGECGHKLYQNSRTNPRFPNVRLFLVCRVNGARCGVYVPDHIISPYAAESFLERFGDLPVVERRYIPASDVSAELEDVQRAISALRDDRASGLFDDDPEDYRDRMRVLLARRKELQAQGNRPARWETRELDRTIREEWERRTPRGRGDLIAAQGLVLALYPAHRRRNIATKDRTEWFTLEEWDALWNAVEAERDQPGAVS